MPIPPSPSITASSRTGKRARTTPVSAGLPDPRALTDYELAFEEKEGVSKLTVNLLAPCIIRVEQLGWTLINCADGGHVTPDAYNAPNNVTIELIFYSEFVETIAFLDVPYQDMAVQNFQGGFVRPGARWFRSPV